MVVRMRIVRVFFADVFVQVLVIVGMAVNMEMDLAFGTVGMTMGMQKSADDETVVVTHF